MPIYHYFDPDGSGHVGTWCDSCAPDGNFDTWPISESDTPVHCEVCDGLAIHTLTSDGIAYVRERVVAADGDPDVLAAWYERWRDCFSPAERELLDN